MTHFMVLREDLLTPLREGIAAFRERCPQARDI